MSVFLRSFFDLGVTGLPTVLFAVLIASLACVQSSPRAFTCRLLLLRRSLSRYSFHYGVRGFSFILFNGKLSSKADISQLVRNQWLFGLFHIGDWSRYPSQAPFHFGGEAFPDPLSEVTKIGTRLPYQCGNLEFYRIEGARLMPPNNSFGSAIL